MYATTAAQPTTCTTATTGMVAPSQPTPQQRMAALVASAQAAAHQAAAVVRIALDHAVAGPVPCPDCMEHVADLAQLATLVAGHAQAAQQHATCVNTLVLDRVSDVVAAERKATQRLAAQGTLRNRCPGC